MRPLRFPGQSLLVTVLVILTLVGLTASVVVGWVRDQVLDEAGYIETVTPLAEDRQIREEVTDRATETIMEVGGDLLPLVPAVGQQAVQPLVRASVALFVESPAFHTLWVSANRSAHEQILATLRDEPSTLTRGNKVVLDLSQSYAQIRVGLLATGQTQIVDAIPWDSLALRYELLRTSVLDPAKSGVQLIDDYGSSLPAATVVAAVLAVVLARRRRAILAILGIGAIVIGVSTVLVVAVARSIVQAGLSSADQTLGVLAYDLVSSSLRHRGWVVAAAGAVVFLLSLVPWERIGQVGGSRAGGPTGDPFYDQQPDYGYQPAGPSQPAERYRPDNGYPPADYPPPVYRPPAPREAPTTWQPEARPGPGWSPPPDNPPTTPGYDQPRPAYPPDDGPTIPWNPPAERQPRNYPPDDGPTWRQP